MKFPAVTVCSQNRVHCGKLEEVKEQCKRSYDFLPVALPNLDVAEDEEGAVDEEVAFILEGTREVQKWYNPVAARTFPFNFSHRNKSPGLP